MQGTFPQRGEACKPICRLSSSSRRWSTRPEQAQHSPRGRAQATRRKNGMTRVQIARLRADPRRHFYLSASVVPASPVYGFTLPLLLKLSRLVAFGFVACEGAT